MKSDTLPSLIRKLENPGHSGKTSDDFYVETRLPGARRCDYIADRNKRLVTMRCSCFRALFRRQRSARYPVDTLLYWTAFRPSSNQMSAVHADRVIVLSFSTGRIYTVDGVGADIWKCMAADDGSFGPLLSDLESTAPPELIEQTHDFFKRLESAQLIASSDTRWIADRRSRQGLQPPPRKALPIDKVTIWYCIATLLRVKVWLRIYGLGETLERISSHTAELDAPLDHATVQLCVKRVSGAAALFPGRAECLEQSLCAVRILRRLGCDAELRLGVRGFPLSAHAWVEVGSEPITEFPDVISTFRRLA